MKKIITITNAYTWYNKGDAGILLGTVNTLKQIYGENNLDIRVLSFTPEEDKKRYCMDKTITNVYSNVLNPHPYKHTKIGKIIAVLKLFMTYIYMFIFSNLNLNHLINKYDNFRTLSESDFIIVCGGGFLGGKKMESLMHVFQMYINTKFNKKVYVMGTSIEPMSNWGIKKITDKVLKRMTHVYAREIITYEYLKKILPESKFTLIPDMAFMLEDIYKKNPLIEELRNKSNIIYGITVRKWNFPNSKNPAEQMEKYINSIVDFMNQEIENNNIFVFVPQVIVGYADDTDIARKIKLKLKKTDGFKIITDDLSPVEIKTLISNFDYFIGTRMHSNIFAISMKIPTIAIAYEKKTNGIMHTANLDDYVIEIEEINKKILTEKTKMQISNDTEIKNELNFNVEKIRKEILEKMKKILIEEE